MFFRSLPWDSNFFGCKTARLDITGDCAEDDLKQALEQDFDVCYIYVFQNMPEISARLLSLGAVLYDHKATFGKTLSASDAGQPDPMVLELKNSSSEAVDLAVSSGVYSRFYLDPGFRPKQPALYERWIANCFEQENGRVFAIHQGDVLAAIEGVTVSDGMGHLELIAVHPDFRRRGFAGKLIRAADDFYLASGASAAEVVTQLDNKPACATYQSCGYTLNETVDVWHLWKKSSGNSGNANTGGGLPPES